MTGPNTNQVGGIAAEGLRQIVSRIEKLGEEIDALNGDKSDVYKQAKSQGFDVPAIRQIVSERKKRRIKGDAEFEEAAEIIDLYKHALGMSA